VVTTGTFDGVHRGHKIILERLNKSAREIKGQSVLITFHPHPRTVIHPDSADLKLLNSQEEKEMLLAKTGLKHLIVIPFTPEFSQITAEEYIREILVNRIGVKKLVIGHDHRFGKGRGGSFKELKEMAPGFGFEVEEIPALEIEGVVVSSSKIRQALLSGNVEYAWTILGYAYSLQGTVIKGDKLGRTLGFPTANILPDDPLKLVPADGIYAVRVIIGRETKNGMLHIGPRRTLDKMDRRIEVNIFDWDRDLYGKKISLQFIKKLRDELRFESLQELKEQMKFDKLRSEKIFEELDR
jgi:riboflavin kinase/FMN adenylyltransferase